MYYDNGWRLGMAKGFGKSLDQKRSDILDIVNPIFQEAGCEKIVLEFLWSSDGKKRLED